MTYTFIVSGKDNVAGSAGDMLRRVTSSIWDTLYDMGIETNVISANETYAIGGELLPDQGAETIEWLNGYFNGIQDALNIKLKVTWK